MFGLLNATKVALLSLCAAGFYGTWYLLLNNDTTSYLSACRDIRTPVLPQTKEPLRSVYVGIPTIDNQLTVLVLFFWQIVDGSHPAASLFTFHFATQVFCGWGLSMIEGQRRGHAWRVVSFIGTMGFLLQNIAYAIVVPICLIIYLSTSPLVSSKRISAFLMDSSTVAAIPISLAVGFALPAVLMSLPAPSVITFDQKQIFTAVWQLFPVWAAIVQAIVPSLLVVFTEDRPSSTKKSCISDMNALRQVYTLLLLIAGIGQTSTFTLMAASVWFPDLFASEFSGAFDPTNVFVPSAITPSAKMSSLGSGAHVFLQYDELVGSASMALFATALYVHAYQGSRSIHHVGSVFLRGLVAAIITGPLGYAVAMAWARDEMIFAEDEEANSKKFS